MDYLILLANMALREIKENKVGDQLVGTDSSILDNVEEMTRFKVSCIKLKRKSKAWNLQQGGGKVKNT